MSRDYPRIVDRRVSEGGDGSGGWKRRLASTGENRFCITGGWQERTWFIRSKPLNRSKAVRVIHYHTCDNHTGSNSGTCRNRNRNESESNCRGRIRSGGFQPGNRKKESARGMKSLSCRIGKRPATIARFIMFRILVLFVVAIAWWSVTDAASASHPTAASLGSLYARVAPPKDWGAKEVRHASSSVH